MYTCIYVAMCIIISFTEYKIEFAFSNLAEGGVDYGCPLPIMFEYTFLAGETCITAVDPIPINDDRISERDERFKICIIEASLPLGVQESRDCATITIKDNDSK